MTLKAFQQKGYTDTESQIAELEKLILSQYQEAEKLIDAELQKLFAKMSDLNPEDRYNWLIQYDRNIKLKQNIRDIYSKYDKNAYNLTAESGRIAISNNYYRQFYTLEWQYPLSFSLLPDGLIEYAVTGQLAAWNELNKTAKAKFISAGIWPPEGTLTDLFAKNRIDTVLKIQGQINSGIMIGDSYTKIARRVKGTIGDIVGGKASGQLAKALRVVRTEGNRLLNTGAYASSLEAESQGAEIMRMWDASLDTRTRPAHGAADGQKRTADKPFDVGGESLMYPGDSAGSSGNVINCRCTTVDVIGDWEPSIRRGRDPVTGENSIFDYKTFDQWASDNNLTTNKYGRIYANS